MFWAKEAEICCCGEALDKRSWQTGVCISILLCLLLTRFAWSQSNTTYTIISGISKLFALSLTYPYQVVRSRIQNNATAHLYPTIPACIARTWREERFRGFYRGLGTNLVRVLPGTCVTFVVYENLAWLLKTSARRREDELIQESWIFRYFARMNRKVWVPDTTYTLWSYIRCILWFIESQHSS